MKICYGWVIVAVGIVISCIGMGAMASLGVFLQPMAETMGWSRTAISGAALLNFLCMGVGAFLWGSLSDRLGTRLVVLAGGAAALASSLGMAAGPMVGGFIHDTFGSYAWMFIASAAIGLGAVTVALTFPAPRPVRITVTALAH